MREIYGTAQKEGMVFCFHAPEINSHKQLVAEASFSSNLIQISVFNSLEFIIFIDKYAIYVIQGII